MLEIIYLIIVVLLNVLANLLMRIGASNVIDNNSFYDLLNWKSVTGVICFGIAAFFYFLLLRKIPLSLAQGFIAIQFVLTIAASYFILGERLDIFQWLSIFLIALGIAMLGWRTLANEQIAF